MNLYLLIPATLFVIGTTYYLATRYQIVRRPPPKSLAQQLREAEEAEEYKLCAVLRDKMKRK